MRLRLFFFIPGAYLPLWSVAKTHHSDNSLHRNSIWKKNAITSALLFFRILFHSTYHLNRLIEIRPLLNIYKFLRNILKVCPMSFINITRQFTLEWMHHRTLNIFSHYTQIDGQEIFLTRTVNNSEARFD